MAASKEISEDQGFNYLTEFQRYVYFNKLTLKHPKWARESTDQAIIEAKVDLNPHQVNAASFAFRNPLSGGVILADEVGLGKTIETGLVLSQLWAEGRRQVLIVAPKSLRHQWQDELLNLFFLPSSIIDTSLMRKIEKSSGESPLNLPEKILITNEHFFNRFSAQIKAIGWDLIVIDEAHKLRNVWRPAKNQAKRAKLIRDTIRPFKKLLLTATPMQNNLMELYGLASFVDEAILGTPESFQRTFQRIPEEEREERLSELRYRMQKFFHRELRKNVCDFIKYTNRNARTFEFDPDDEEEQLRKEFEAYLRREDNFGIPPMATHLLRLIYCKLLASSSFALKKSLLGIYKRLILIAVERDDPTLFEKLIQKIEEKLTLQNGVKTRELEDFYKLLFHKIRPKNYEGIRKEILSDQNEDLDEIDNEITDNYEDDDILEVSNTKIYISEETEKLLDEADEILQFIDITRKIRQNTKGFALQQALKEQFEKANTEGWPEKAVIFTEFQTTQQYVINVLEQMGLSIDNDIVVFNGSVGGAESRRALVNEFRDNKKIFLTTEAGAEGLNLQFCNLLINYDLPWNPQRIEQRIGRCHRYGQKLDVVVVNFINKKNHADRRVLELLGEKFNLFQGAFGASDEVLGAIESGTDIEREILNLYLKCRTPDEIESEFSKLMADNKEQIDLKISKAKEQLMDQFDEDVHKKLRDLHTNSTQEISGRQGIVRDCFLSVLVPDRYTFNEGILALDSVVGEKQYTFQKSLQESAELLHSNHPIFQTEMSKLGPYQGHLKINYSNNHKVSQVENLVGKKGLACLIRVRFTGIDSFDALIPIIKIDDNFLSEEAAAKVFALDSEVLSEDSCIEVHNFQSKIQESLAPLREKLSDYSEEIFHEEVEKVELYYEDLERQKLAEKEDLQIDINKLKKERRKLKIDQARELNKKIQRLKNQMITKDEEINEFRRQGAKKEKKRLEDLENKSKITMEQVVLFIGTVEIL